MMDPHTRKMNCLEQGGRMNLRAAVRYPAVSDFNSAAAGAAPARLPGPVR